MIKGRSALEQEQKEDILTKPKTVRVMALEAILNTYGGSSYRKMPIEQLKAGCRAILAARLKQDDVVIVMSHIENLKTPEMIFTWITEEIFK